MQGLNTVEIGDKFENKSFKIIKKALKRGDFSLNEKHVRIFQKKKYSSASGNNTYEFDISMEIWHPNAERYTMLWLLECKSYSTKRVPLGDIAEFAFKVDSIKGRNTKAVLISDCGFASGVQNIAEEYNIMLIDVSKESTDYNIVLHREHRDKVCAKDFNEHFANFLKQVFCEHNIDGYEILSAREIEDRTQKILFSYNGLKSPIEINEFARYVHSTYGVEICFETYPKNIKGFFDPQNNKIGVNVQQFSVSKPFVLGHELGHYFLHRNLKLNGEIYGNYEDAEFDVQSGKHELKNLRNWIEWQANAFAIALLLPINMLKAELYRYRFDVLRISNNPQRIYVDDQKGNIKDYRATINHLSFFFNASKTLVRNRLKSLGILVDVRKNKGKHGNDFIQNLF